MAGYVPNEWMSRLLEATAGKAQTPAGSVYLGLATALPDDPLTTDLGNIQEVTTAGYARVAVPAFNQATRTAPVKISTPTVFNFGALTADMAVPANYAFLTDKSSGGDIAAPVLTKGATNATGGTFAAGTYFWVITAINALGETLASNEITATLVLNGTQVMTWAAITGATGYKVYRGTATGAENVLVATLGLVTTYTDTGTAGSAAVLPNANTTSSVRYIWELQTPILGRTGEPINVPANTLIIE